MFYSRPPQPDTDSMPPWWHGYATTGIPSGAAFALMFAIKNFLLHHSVFHRSAVRRPTINTSAINASINSPYFSRMLSVRKTTLFLLILVMTSITQTTFAQQATNTIVANQNSPQSSTTKEQAHQSNNSAQAAPEIFRFILEPQTLSTALITLADVAGMTIVLPAEDIADYQAKAVVGHYTVLQALDIMLAGSGLYAEISASGTLKITRGPRTAPSGNSASQTSTLPAIEEILVTGAFNAYQFAAQLKRDKAEITEVITEEDIGKMPDSNVAEALQRIPGVQLERHNGVGSVIRVRGFAQNQNLLNGHELLTGLELYQSNNENYEGSFESFPIDLLQRIEIYKTPAASHLEGSIGGSIDFISRSGLSLSEPLLTGELGLTHSGDNTTSDPSALLVYGNNWQNKFGLSAAISYRSSHNRVDNTNMYTQQGAFIDYIGDNERNILSLPERDVSKPLLYPAFSGINSTSQQTETIGSDIRLEYAFDNNQHFDLQWLHLLTDIREQRQTVLHNIILSNSTAKHLELIDHGPLMTIENGDFTAFNLTILSRGERNQTNTDNLRLNHRIDFSDRLNLFSSIQYSHAKSENRAGEITSEKGHVSGVRFVGTPSENPDIPGGDRNSGWDTITLNPADGNKERRFFLQRNTEGLPVFRYDTQAWLEEREYGAFSNQVANGYDNVQRRLALRSDLNLSLHHGFWSEIKTGFRIHSHHNSYDKLAYLTDYSRTENVGGPNLYDSQGNLVTPASYDPTIAPSPEQNNIGIRLPVFYDLCGNGGLITGAVCDIDGDGLDDNQPLGPYGYDTGNVHWGLTLTDTYTSDGHRLLDYLYGRYIDDTDKLPNYAPSLTWNEAPNRLRVYDDFFSTGNYQHRILLPDLNPVTTNPEKWMDQLSPDTPGEMRALPLESWEIERQTNALYLQGNFITDHNFFSNLGVTSATSTNTRSHDNVFTGNIGVRLLQTRTEIIRNTIPDSIFDIRVSPEVSYSGIPLFYQSHRRHSSNTHVLPSINTTYHFSEQLKLRTSLAKTIAYPRLQDLGKGFVPLDWTFTATTFASADEGNPDLAPYKVSQWDIALEHYWDSANYFALNVFVKDIQSFIQYETRIENKTIPANSDGGADRVATVSVNRPENRDGGLLKGVELSLQKLWHSGFGVHANYTYMDSNTESHSLTHAHLPLPGISKHTYNLIGMYENERLHFRIAYNRRSHYLSPFNAINAYSSTNGEEQFLLAEFVEGSARLDARLSYLYSPSLTFSAEAYNLTSTSYSTYLEFESNTHHYQSSRPAFEFRLKYKM
ncbi:Vitamin B12 transporter BtuB [Thalassocella blandensis]|nr:Vitamin B12 transporter BtuB [Thalassocella blandensis]